MHLRLRRPRYQRNVRVLLAFALAIPSAGLFQVSGTNPVTVLVAGLTIAGIVLVVWDAYRWIVVITRYGIGVAGTFGSPTEWLTWAEIVRVELDEPVVSITTRDQRLYQLQLDTRVARLLSRMVERNLSRPAAPRSAAPRRS
ncbi:MAG: hypothetical protein EA382_12215 [Spirochaetaceae bacterium]|nr:MAG: hypothetical protein EA382_12215 [Spirochaetaceae bacterium]